MAKSENKTRPTAVSPKKFIAALQDGPRKRDAEALLPWFEKMTGLKPRMWGPSMIGFGRYRYKYESGSEGEAMMTGFSPRKAEMVIYTMPGYQADSMQGKLRRLGKHKLGKSCLYIKRLSDVDMDVLAEIVKDGMAYMRSHYQTRDD
jgi:Domain of unknown function (DU1801)